MSRNAVVGIIVVLVLIVGGWWMLRLQKNAPVTPSPEATQPASESATASSSPSAAMSETTEIKVSGNEFAFLPAKLSVKKGQKVMISFQNTGKLPHNLTIDKLGIATKTIGAGQTDTVEFTADQAGTFAIYCSVGTHRQQGMEGTLTVQ